MASHHHHRRHHHHHRRYPPPPLPTTPCCCCADLGSTSCCISSHQTPPPPADPLLECLVSRLLQYPLPPGHSRFHHRSSVLPSLLERIEALESSLHSLSSPHRDAAARVIQTHFRSFLARRSRTLRHLKELAAIKSSFLNLKSSVSKVNRARLNLAAVSDRAMDLLLQLDSIQNNDPMIRDGKRSISRDLDAFLAQIDRVAVERRELLLSRKSVKIVANPRQMRNSKILKDEKELVDKLKDRVEKIQSLSRALRTDEEEGVELEGFRNFSEDDDRSSARKVGSAPTMKKNVTFSENGIDYRVIRTGSDRSSSGDDDDAGSSDDQGKNSAVDGKLKGSYVIVRDYEEEADLDNLASSPGSSDGSEARGRMGDESDFTFPVPKPERMGLREDYPKKRNGVLKIGD